jgi:hypothetical protein
MAAKLPLHIVLGFEIKHPMRHRGLSNVPFLLAMALIVAACPLSFAQGPAADAPTSAVDPVPTLAMPQPIFETHRFLDRQNRILFVAVAAVNGADFAVTRANLQTGGRELNPMVRPFTSSTPVLALNFAAESAGVVAISYFFHKTGHHQLERLTSYVNIGSSAGAVTYGLLNR